MNITDIQACADFFQDNYLKTFYFVITYNGNSFMLIGEKANFPHLMGIQSNTYRSNGYNKPQYLFNDIIDRNPISTAIIPNNIATTSKMYKKVQNFTNSTDIFWKNSGPLTINYNPALSSTKLNNVDVLLTDINTDYMLGWISNNKIAVNANINMEKYCICTWIDESNGSQQGKEKYNHMAIYLRWCMEHELMGEDFLKEHDEVVKQVKANPSSVDLRVFIQDKLDGQLVDPLFNQKGRAFAGYYYGEGDSPYYPVDIDDYALKYFGPSRYHSNEFQQEAYLFIPFDEEYYHAMAKVIDKRFVNWQGQDFDEDTLETSDVAQAIIEYLDCECTYFPSMADDDPIMSAYSYAQRLGEGEGFIPVLIKPDETLLECLVMNADPENDADCYEFDLKTVDEYRKKMLAAPVKDGKAVLEELTGHRKEEAEDDDMDWNDEVLGEMEGGYEKCRFSGYWDSDTDMTYPLILAKIPVKNPWEIFAYLPLGNWNECPDTPELMAVAKYWFEQYGAVPAAMSHDELEFLLSAPIPKEKAMEVAVEQYGFCPDMDQNFDELGALADTLWQSTVWYFWWD